MSSYISPNIEKRPSPLGGFGLFARAPIRKGEVVIDFSEAPGTYLTSAEADALYEGGNDYMIQVDEDRHFVATTPEEMEDSDYLNHSCDPNCGIDGSLKIVAMRDIEPNEEVTFDYAMSESAPYEMKCLCGRPHCRGKTTGEDWKRKDLQEKYRGYFSDYLQRKIDAVSSPLQ